MLAKCLAFQLSTKTRMEDKLTFANLIDQGAIKTGFKKKLLYCIIINIIITANPIISQKPRPTEIGEKQTLKRLMSLTTYCLYLYKANQKFALSRENFT